jgi:protein tyrosine kinase modulator
MLGHRELTVEDYVDILKRRFWLILCSTIVLLAVGLGLSYILPPEYESQTLILIQQQKVPEDYVKPVVDVDLDARLASMKEQILSRSRLEQIITRYNLFAGGNNTMDDRVDLTRKAIKITQIHSEQARGGMPGFFVSFQAHDARTAQLVCGEITSLFVSNDLNAREQSAEGTTAFLRQQLDNAKRNLDEQDAKLADFEVKYLGRLPDQESSNTNTLQALTTQLDAATQSVSRLQQEETFLQAMVTQQTHELQSNESPATTSIDDRRKELNALIDQKRQLEAIYTSDYPDVVEVTRKITALQAEIDHASSTPAPKTAPVERPDSPQIQELKARLKATQLSMVVAKQEQAGIEQKVRTYEARIDASPMVDQEYKKITRDHETALKFYNSLLTKMNESSMATALEQRQQGEQFSVMDAPNLPEEPKFPNHWVFGGGGFVSGLFLGLIFAGLLEYRDTSLRNERDIWAFTKLPTLALLSHIEGLPKPAATDNPKHRNLFSRMHKPIESDGN